MKDKEKSKAIDYKQIAKEFMDSIAQDSGCVNRHEPMQYPETAVNQIAAACKGFFSKYPELLNEGVINELAIGDVDKSFHTYGHLEGYDYLEDSLEDYFNSL